MTMTVGEICKEKFPGVKFSKTTKRLAGKLLKSGDVGAVVEYLESQEPVKGAFCPPAKCQIITYSRPLSEWAIARASAGVQEYIYGLSLADRKKEEKLTLTAAEHAEWFARTGVDTAGFTHVQGLDKIRRNALNTYDGVEVQAPQDRLAIPAGQPGHVPAWQREQGLLSDNKHRRMRAWYSYHNSRPKPGRRTVRTKAECLALGASGALLAVVSVGEDWALIDLRGLLRNAYWRGVVRAGQISSVKELLDLFTGNPTLDPRRQEATFLYREGVLPIFSCRPIREKYAPERLLKMTAPVDGISRYVSVVSVDLGQTNPAAMGYYRVCQEGGKLQADLRGQSFLSPEILRDWAAFRERCDELEARLREEALAELSEEDQVEYRRVFGITGADYAARLVEKLQLDFDALPWHRMTGWSTYITDALLDAGKKPEAHHHFTVSDKAAKRGRKKKQAPTDGVQVEVTEVAAAKSEQKLKEKPADGDWACRFIREKLPEETRKRFQDALWKLKRASTEYAKLSKQKRDLARHAASWIVKQARKIVGTNDVVIVVENINVRFFHGNGKREVGWESFFSPKKENRWFVQALHKALTDLGPHKGILVVEAAPYNTSLRCPSCKHIDRANRVGEEFRCVACGRHYHADLDVAPYNILQVALSGESIKNPNKQGKKRKQVKKAEQDQASG